MNRHRSVWFCLLAVCGVAPGFLRAAAEQEINLPERLLYYDTSLRQIKLAQFVQRIALSDEEIEMIEKRLAHDTEYQTALAKLFALSQDAARAKRAVLDISDRTSAAYHERYRAVLAADTNVKGQSVVVENLRLEHCEEFNNQFSYTAIDPLIKEFVAVSQEYYSLVLNMRVDAHSEHTTSPPFDFGALSARVDAGLAKLFESRAAERMGVPPEIAAVWWRKYILGSVSLVPVRRAYAERALTALKDGVRDRLGRALNRKYQREFLLGLKKDQTVVSMVSESKRALARTIIHQRVLEDVGMIESAMIRAFSNSFGKDFQKHFGPMDVSLREYKKAGGDVLVDTVFDAVVVPAESNGIQTLRQLLSAVSAAENVSLNTPANLVRFYCWGEEASWPAPGIAELSRRAADSTRLIAQADLERLPQLIAELEEIAAAFKRYETYFERVVKEGSALSRDVHAAPPTVSGAGEQEASVRSDVAYSYVQAGKLVHRFRALRSGAEQFRWRAAAHKIESLGLPAEESARFEELRTRFEERWQVIAEGEDTLPIRYERMRQSLAVYGIKERELAQIARSMPDGLDPLFVGGIDGISSDIDAR